MMRINNDDDRKFSLEVVRQTRTQPHSGRCLLITKKNFFFYPLCLKLFCFLSPSPYPMQNTWKRNSISENVEFRFGLPCFVAVSEGKSGTHYYCCQRILVFVFSRCAGWKALKNTRCCTIGIFSVAATCLI